MPQDYIQALKALVVSEEEKLRLTQEKQALLKEAEENRPKVEFAEAVSFSEDSLEFGEYAKIIGTGRNRLMQKLRELNILMKNSTIPYQRYCDAGYFEVSQEITANGKLIPFALITGKGQMWLYQKLKEAKLIVPKTLTSLQPSLRLEY